MIWGTFGAVHIASLIIAAGIIVGLYFLLKNKSEELQTKILGILSFAGVLAIVFNLLMWQSPLEYLPLHLCSWTAIILPFAVLTKNRTLCNLLILWGAGSLLALVINTAQANFKIFSLTFAFYFIPHVLEVGVTILIFALKRAKMDVKCILSTLSITVLAYTLVHFINILINSYCAENGILNPDGNLVFVNYMYSVRPDNPLLEIMFTKPYWYMFKAIPFVLIYLCAVYHKQIIEIIKKKQRG